MVPRHALATKLFASLTALAAAAALSGLVAPAAAQAAPGDLDPSFSGDGRLTTHVGTDGQVDSIALQGRKVLAGGTSITSSGSDWLLTRYTGRGALDRSFGKRGRLRLDLRGNDVFGEMLVLPSGKILGVGVAKHRFTVVRLTPDGRLDRTFGGGDGVVRTSFGTTFAVATQVVRVTRGRFVVAGWAGEIGDGRVALARYQANGRLDKSFSNDGKVTTGFWKGEETNDVAELLRWGDSSMVLVVGHTSSGGPTGFDVALASFTPRGRLEPLFGGGDGKTVQHLAPNDYIAGAVMQPHGTVLVGGYVDMGMGWDAALLRFNTSGHLDSGWGGGDGVVLHDSGTALEYWSGMARSGRRVVMVGQIDGAAAVLRVRRSGAMDAGFGSGGRVILPYSGGDSALYTATQQRDGRLLAGGRAPATLAADGFYLARLLR